VADYLDARRAAAESALDRLDGDRDDDVTEANFLGLDEVGLRVEAEADLDTDVEQPLEPDEFMAPPLDATAAELLDAIAEAFNARDMDRLLEVVARDGEVPGLLGYDRDNLPDAIEDLWIRRPTSCVTRGIAHDECVGVLWEHDGTSWWRVATMHVDDVTDGTVGVLEFSDDASLLDEVEAEWPDQDLEEGSRWAEWEEGVDGD
jgi:hypothetical protein